MKIPIIIEELSKISDDLCAEAAEDIDEDDMSDAPVAVPEKIYIGERRSVWRTIAAAASAAAAAAVFIAIPFALRQYGGTISDPNSSASYVHGSGKYVTEEHLEPFRQYFEQKRERQLSENENSPRILKDLGYYAIPVDMTKSADGVTVNVHAILGCENTMYISWSVGFDDPALTALNEKNELGLYRLMLTAYTSYGSYINGGSHGSDERGYAGKYVECWSRVDDGCELIKLVAIPRSHDNGSVISVDAELPELEFDIPVALAEPARIAKDNINAAFGERQLMSLTADPFGLKLEFADMLNKSMYLVRIFMKDGTEERLESGGSSHFWEQRYTFSYPIDVKDIVRVEITDMNGAAVMVEM